MTTAALSDLFYLHQPFKSSSRSAAGAAADENYSSSSIAKMTTSSYHNRRSSATSATSAASSGASRPLSTLEDSGNPNNREIYQRSGSQQTLQGAMADSSSNNNRSAQAAPQQLSRSNSGEYHEEIVVEEKRKRLHGSEGYTLHRYTLGRLLGKGGFAKVYLCTAMDTGKNYAAKVVPKANLVKARARQKVRCVVAIRRCSLGATDGSMDKWIVALSRCFSHLLPSLFGSLLLLLSDYCSCKPRSKSTAI